MSAPGLAGSRGYVDTDDLGFLATHYFTAPAGSPFCDIGPETEENGVGKGEPYPDNEVDFDDLVPFSFLYGIVAPPVGVPGEFRFTPEPNDRPFRGLDAIPTVIASLPTDQVIQIGQEFAVTIALSGNVDHIVKAAEVEIAFDESVIELVSATENAVEVLNGTSWSKAKLIEGVDGKVGVVVAALGEAATISGNPVMSTLTFRWIDDHASGTEIRVASVKLADETGAIYEGEGSALGFGARGVIPAAYALYQNYPNPFNPTTTIRFDLPENANVQLVIYNVMGQLVRTLVSSEMVAGAHHVAWDGMNDGGQAVGTGLYIYRISANDFDATHKMLLTR